MASSLSLPQDITEKIGELVCPRRCNNRETSDIVVRINTSTTASKCQDEVTEWILGCLEKPVFDHIVDQMGQWLFRIVVGTLYDDYEDEETGKILNQVTIAIHLDVPHSPSLEDQEMDKDELITVDEIGLRKTLKAVDVLDALTNEPTYVTGIGVSAVSSEYMTCLWREIIIPREYKNTMAGNGGGYMVHCMWMRMPDGDWLDVREQSYRFGWGNKIFEI